MRETYSNLIQNCDICMARIVCELFFVEYRIVWIWTPQAIFSNFAGKIRQKGCTFLREMHPILRKHQQEDMLHAKELDQ